MHPDLFNDVGTCICIYVCTSENIFYVCKNMHGIWWWNGEYQWLYCTIDCKMSKLEGWESHRTPGGWVFRTLATCKLRPNQKEVSIGNDQFVTRQ